MWAPNSEYKTGLPRLTLVDGTLVDATTPRTAGPQAVDRVRAVAACGAGVTLRPWPDGLITSSY